MRETKANTLLNQYLREKRIYCYYELKIASGKLFSFSKIETNQDEGLPALANEGLVWKLSDEDSRKKPCDGFCAPPLPAYLVVKFGPAFYMIHYADIQEMKASGKKSITEQEAQDISIKVVHIGH